MTRMQILPGPRRLAYLTALAFSFFQSVAALETDRDDVQAFVREMSTEHGLDAEYVESVLAGAEVQQSILDAISRPAEKTVPWHRYRKIFITDKRIEAGRAFWMEHGERMNLIAADTGVPPEIMAGILGVETAYGQITGNYRVVDALSTLAFEYPPRSRFFRGELRELFLLADEESLDIKQIKGSYAGAMGAPQFIPSSYRAYAADGDGDGRRDLFNSWDDVLMSVANYFEVHKWKSGEPVAVPGSLRDGASAAPTEGLKPLDTVGELSEQGVLFATDQSAATPAGLWELEGIDGPEYWVGFHNLYVITRYNRSVMYALAVHELGNRVGQASAATSASAAQP